MEENVQEAPIISEDQKSSFPQRIKNKKILIITAIIVLMLIILSAVLIIGRGKSSAVEEENLLKSQMSSSDFKSAENSAKTGLEKDPNNKALLIGIIDAIASEGNQTGTENESFNKAKPYVEKALNLYPTDSQVLTSIGYVYETAGKYNEALDYYNKAIKSNPENALAYLRISNAQNFLGNSSASKTALDKSFSLDPDNPLIQRSYADQLASQGKLDSAYDLYIKAANPGNSAISRATALSSASNIKQKQGDINTALKLSSESVDVDPSCAPCITVHAYNTFFNDASSAAARGKSIELLKASEKINPRISYNYLLEAYILRQSGGIDSALDALKTALTKVDQDNTIVSPLDKNKWKGIIYYEISQTHSMKNDLAKTTQNLANAIEIYPEIKNSIKEDIQKRNYFQQVKGKEEFKFLAGV